MRIMVSTCALIASTLALTSCSSLRSDASPDVVYSSSAEAARLLQVPPDLTDVSSTEQFVVPGTSGSAVARNTLLPQFSSVRFERSGDQSWLAFDQAPEQLWPQLLAFIRSEKYLVAQTQPVSGVIFTQWRPASAVARGSLLKNLIGNDETYDRIGFRLERNGEGARLFARSQVTDEEGVGQVDSSNARWPVSSHDPESTSALLSRLLAFLGIEEQRSRGILDAKQAQAIMRNATVQTNGSGSQLVIYRGFQPSFSAVMDVLEQLDYAVISSDDGVGRIEFNDDQTPLVLELTPTHISEVRVAVTDAGGRRLPAATEQRLLNALLDRLA